jgi:hypothetical protein
MPKEATKTRKTRAGKTEKRKKGNFPTLTLIYSFD